MAYIVVYQAADGASGYEPCDDLQSAILAAERMRNVDDVEAPRIFRTEEVKFDFRPYYRIEVSTEMPSAVSPPAVAPPLEPVFDSGSVEASLSAEEVVGWPDDVNDDILDSLVAEPEIEAPAPVPTAESSNGSVDVADLDSSDAAGAADEVVDEATGSVEEVTDSVISPRRGLFGR